MYLKMLNDRVFLKLEKPQERVVNGIVLPATVEDLGEHYKYATICGFGDGKKIDRSMDRIPMADFKLGDKVIIGKFAGTRLIIEDDEYLVVRAPEIYGVVED